MTVWIQGQRLSLGQVERGIRHTPGHRVIELDLTAPTVAYGAGGYRSMIPVSVMPASGFRDTSDLIGGYGAWEQARLPAAACVGGAH